MNTTICREREREIETEYGAEMENVVFEWVLGFEGERFNPAKQNN